MFDIIEENILMLSKVFINFNYAHKNGDLIILSYEKAQSVLDLINIERLWIFEDLNVLLERENEQY